MELPPPDIADQPHEKPGGFYAASGNVSLKPARRDGARIAANVLAALAFASLAGWLLFEDLSYSGDPLFQMSWSLPALALFLGAFSLLAFLLAIFPKRIVIGADILLVLRSAFGYPLTVWTDNATASRALSAAILAFALLYLACALRKRLRIGERPWFSLRHSFAIFIAGVLLAVVAIPATLLGFTHAGRNLMGDYVRLSPRAVSLVERVFEKGGQRVHLVGMMHIGDGSYYEDLKKRMSAPVAGIDAKRLVLTEGVSDRENHLPGSFASGETYARWARLLGLEVQEALHGPGLGNERDPARLAPGERVHFLNADIDISELDPRHRDILVSLLELFEDADPVRLMLFTPEGIDGRGIEDLFIDGLIEGRNAHLMKIFEEVAPAYAEVYIPWGAAHLTDVEKRLRAQGYEQVDEIIRPIIGLLTQHRG